MTKSDIINDVHACVGALSKKEAAEIVEAVFETIKETLARGEGIELSGFGTFLLRDKKERPGRDPQTGEPISIPARRITTFKASRVVKDKLNS